MKKTIWRWMSCGNFSSAFACIVALWFDLINFTICVCGVVECLRSFYRISFPSVFFCFFRFLAFAQQNPINFAKNIQLIMCQNERAKWRRFDYWLNYYSWAKSTNIQVIPSHVLYVAVSTSRLIQVIKFVFTTIGFRNE